MQGPIGSKNRKRIITRMRTLVLLDDIWHPAEVPRAGLKRLSQFGFEFDWIENTADWSARRMAEYAIVILTKANDISSADGTSWMSKHVQQAFVDYVHRGNGLLVLHSGAAGYEGAATLRNLMGGYFREHPEQCLVTVEPHSPHALTAGCESFTVLDEHYFMHLDDERADVFVTTTSEHGTQPGGWILSKGEGRVCVLTPGHNLDVWTHPAYQQLLRNALCWCDAGKE